MFLASLITIVLVVLVLGAVVIANDQNQTRQNELMATINERLAAVETALDEAGTELAAELAKLREQIANVISPEALETLGRLEVKAKALADIIPNAPPA